jgi:hypothetical protein
MKTKCVLVSGTPTSTWTYKLQLCTPGVRSHIWEMCIASVSASCNETVNKIVQVSSNFVESEIVINGDVRLSNTPLCIFHLKGRSGDKIVVNYGMDKWHEIQFAQEKLQLYVTDVETAEHLTGNITIFLEVLYRRKA